MYIVHISSVLHCVYFYKGLLTQNATWCQNRGCICISSVRRTYGRIHIPATIILWTELFPKKRREKIQGEILQSIFEYRIQWCFHISTRTTVILQELQDSFEYSVFLQELQCFHTQSSKFPVIPCYSTYRINSSTRNTTTTRLIPCHPVQITTRHLPATISRVSKHSTRQNPVIRLPTAFQGHTAQAGFQ